MDLKEASLLTICSATTKYTLKANDCFRGRIIQPSLLKKNGVTSYSFTLASIDQGEGDVSIAIELRGAGVVDEAYKEELLHRFSDRVKIAVQGRGGRCVELQGMGENGMRRVKIVYEEEMLGWFLLRDGKEERFVLRKPSPPLVAEQRVDPLAAKPKVDFQPVKTPTPPPKPKLVDSEVQTMPLVQPVASASDNTKKRKSERIDNGEELQKAGSISGMKKTARKRSPSPVVIKEEPEAEGSWNVRPPSPFTSLADIKAHGKDATSYNIAAVVESLQISPPLNEDWFMQIYVTDPTMSSERIEIQWYSRQKSLLPNIKAGYILLIKGLRLQSPRFKKSSLVFITHATIDPASLVNLSSYPNNLPSYACLPGQSAPSIRNIELAYAIALATFDNTQRVPGWVRKALKPVVSNSPAQSIKPAADPARSSSLSAQSSKSSNPSNPSSTASHRPAAAAPLPRALIPTGSSNESRKGRPILEIKDIEEFKFCDVFGQILKGHVNDNKLASSYAVCLYITDYTSNSEIMDYDSASASKTGVLVGQFTLQVSLFDNQASPLKPLFGGSKDAKVGDFVRIDNLRVKRNEYGLLEGTVVDDPTYKGKRYVSLIRKEEASKYPEIARLQHRKKEQGR